MAASGGADCFYGVPPLPMSVQWRMSVIDPSAIGGVQGF